MYAVNVNDNKWHKILVCIHLGYSLFICVAPFLVQISLMDCLLYLMVIGPRNYLFGLNAWVVWNMRMLHVLIGIKYLDL